MSEEYDNTGFVLHGKRQGPVVTPKDFDEAVALLKEFQFQTDSASIPVCGDCGASEGLCAAGCRIDTFIKRWSK